MNSRKWVVECGLALVLVALPPFSLAAEEDGKGEAPEASTAAGKAAEKAPPNILLITIDTQRADSFGAYGNEGGHSPNIDRLAEAGTVFGKTTAPMGTTFPSHATLLTGLNPRAHGVRYNGDVLEDDVVTLAEILGEAGYETMALVTYGSMVSRGGLGQGFVRTSHEKDGRAAYSTPPRRITAMARGLLKRKRPKPFFMWVHYYHPHAPYELTPYSETALEGYEGAFADGATVKEFYQLKDKVDDADRKALRDLYDGETRQADEAVGRILETLKASGLADDTIVVITSDHGELLGEHDEIGHGPKLWAPVLDVPLVIYDPRNPEKRRVDTRVGIVDIMPTLLEMSGHDVPEGIEGRSLVPALRGKELENAPYYSEVAALAPAQKKKEQKRDEGAVAVFVGDRKLVVQDGESRFFDLAADPGEKAPMTKPSEKDEGPDLAALATAYSKRRGRSGGQVDPKDLSPKVEEELRALGYVE